MDDATAFAIEELKLQLAGLRTDLEHTKGRSVALQVALIATLRSWGRTAEVVEAEVKRALEVTTIDAAKQGASPQFLVEFGSVEETALKSIHHAALDSANQ